MSILKRQVLKENDKLSLCNYIDRDVIHDFEIMSIFAEGGSVICYKAKRSDGELGILKEFYPNVASPLCRDPHDNNLIPEEGHEAYLKIYNQYKDDYISQFGQLKRVVQSDREHELETFFPDFRVYHGIDSDKNFKGAAYIWTAGSEVKTFRMYVNESRSSYSKNPVYNLTRIFRAIRSLTSCIKVMHDNDMIHRDIKPDNFGFKKRDKEYLYDSIQLFDLDSTYQSGFSDDIEKTIASPGYSEPEIEGNSGDYRATRQTDVYSIGATLYFALIDTDLSKEFNYTFHMIDGMGHEEFIKQQVDKSTLFKQLVHQKKDRIIKLIEELLIRCLDTRKNRYQTVDDIADILDDILYFLLPKSIANNAFDGNKWTLAEVEQINSDEEKRILTDAIQYHLYKDPLYKYADDNINFLCVGLGEYAAKFLDKALEIGQIKDKNLNVFVIARSQKEISNYLDKRPELSNFFNVNGSLNNSKMDSYGNIKFITYDFRNFNNKLKVATKSTLELFSNEFGSLPNYIYISIGSDIGNYGVASGYFQQYNNEDDYEDVPNINCTIKYTVISNRNIKPDLQVHPIFVKQENQSLDSDSVAAEKLLKKEIKRMAYNVHLVWNPNKNISEEELRKEFLDPYNYSSCISNVVSIKYKLFSLGIDIDDKKYASKSRLELIVKDFCECLNYKAWIGKYKNTQLEDVKDEGYNQEYEQIIYLLMYLEHRRWVTEKICDGWSMLPVEEAAKLSLKSTKEKKHVCIVRSKPEKYFSENLNVSQWDNRIKPETLDELDFVSYKLHELYKTKATINKNDGDNPLLILDNLINQITNYSLKQKLKIFHEHCQSIFTNNFKYAKMFTGEITQIFVSINSLRSNNVLSKDKHESYISKIDEFQISFQPYLDAVMYKDFKLLDIDLIKNIPFIIWHSSELLFAKEMQVELCSDETDINKPKASFVKKDSFYFNNDSILDSVYIPFMIRPAFIDYFITHKILDSEKYMLIDLIKRIKKYFNSLNYKPNVLIHYFSDEDYSFKDIDNFSFVQYATSDEMIESVLENTEHYMQTCGVNNLILQTRHFESSAREEEILCQRDKYNFDNCNLPSDFLYNVYFSHLKKINIDSKGLINLAGGKVVDVSTTLDDSREISEFWNVYKNCQKWKHTYMDFCNQVTSELRNNPLAEFNKMKGGNKSARFEYSFDSSCLNGVEKVVTYLKSNHFIDISSHIEYATKYTYRVFLYRRCSDNAEEEEFLKNVKLLFSDPYKLMCPQAIYFTNRFKQTFFSTTVWVMHIPLQINNFVVKKLKEKKLSKKYRSLINLLNNSNVISNLSIVYKENAKSTLKNDTTYNAKIRFSFPNYSIIDMFGLVGNVYEAAVFHSFNEFIGPNGEHFDEVLTNLKIKWFDGKANEIDCMLRVGNCFALIECKDKLKLEQEDIEDYAIKIKQISNRLGNRVLPVLLLGSAKNCKYDERIVNGTYVLSFCGQNNYLPNKVYDILTKID